MTDRLSLPVPCSSQTENENSYHYTHDHYFPPPVSVSETKNPIRPSTWPSYFQSKVAKLFLSKPLISLPSFLRQDTWSLSSLSDGEEEEEDNIADQIRTKSTISSSLHFPPVPTILWHLHGSKGKSTHHRLYLPRLDLESPTRSGFPDVVYKIEDINSIPRQCPSPIKTFHTQAILFLFGFIFFPCWWYGWYLSSAADHDRSNNPSHSPSSHQNQNQSWTSCCLNHHQTHYHYHLQHGHHHINYADNCSTSCAYPVITNLYHDIYCYSRFNRFLSFVSFFFLLFILGLLIWLYYGSIYHWWA